MRFHLDTFQSPVGPLLLVWDEAERLRLLHFGEDERHVHRHLARHVPIYLLEHGEAPAAIAGPLRRYFDGHILALAEIPTLSDGTDFQRKVWAALKEIPAATTMSYGALAERIGSPGASRAVGMANNANPIGIVVPCHRVIGSGGTLTGYAGGLDRKQWLLDHERRHAS